MWRAEVDKTSLICSSETVVKAEPALAVPAALSSTLLRAQTQQLRAPPCCSGLGKGLALAPSHGSCSFCSAQTVGAAGCEGFGGRRDTGRSVLPAGLAGEALAQAEGIC